MKNKNYCYLHSTRITQAMKDQIQAMTLEKHTSESNVIRQAIITYVDKRLSDAEITHAQIAELTKKIRYLEDKLELLGLVSMQQVRIILEKLPSNINYNNAIIEASMTKFKQNCINELRSKGHGSTLEAMVLQAYENSGEER